MRRQAEGGQVIVWELEQDGKQVANGNNFADGHHYAMVFNQDGPVRLYRRVGKKRELVLAATRGALVKMLAEANNGTMVPVPEFCQYQDQADELNAITTRIERIIDALRVRGLYDASMKDSK